MSTKGQGHKTIIAMANQGGGARGPFQVGAYAAMEEEGYFPDFYSGISIGAINSAIMAGNQPKNRLEKLRHFWQTISRHAPETSVKHGDWLTMCNPWLELWEPFLTGEPNFFGMPMPIPTDLYYTWHHYAGFLSALWFGQPNFFEFRNVPPFLAQPGTEEATSWYTTAPLRQTLLDHVDFNLINAKPSPVRLFLGAVKVKSGKMVWFENNEQTKITPEHVMASCALPPGFPGVVIDGVEYWDGGCHTNTAIDVLLKNIRGSALHIFMPILFSTEGEEPRTMQEVMRRQKDIQFGSHSTYIVDQLRENIKLRSTLHKVLTHFRHDPQAVEWINGLFEEGREHDRTITTVEYVSPGYETFMNDTDFNPKSLKRREDAGYSAMKHKLAEMAQGAKRKEPFITL